MKGKAKHKVVTSGRLTGAVRGSRSPRALNPGRLACPEPAYSLYSTDSEDQVVTLHQGLDSCAALLSGILQADTAASPSHPRTVKGGAAKSRPSNSQGKKTVKKPPTKTDQKTSQSVQRGPGSAAPRPSTVPAAHSGAKLHPPQRRPHTAVPPPRTSTPPVRPETSVLLSVHQSSSPSLRQTDLHSVSEAERDGEGVRDVSVHDAAADTQTAVAHLNTRITEMSDMQLEAGRDDGVPEDTHGETEEEGKTVQRLLGELKALIAGRGSAAEGLLGQLERAVSSPQISDGASSIQAESASDLSSLHMQNTQLRRRVRSLNQQLKEREKVERHQNLEILCNSEALSLQEELITAQSRLQELQDDLAGLRDALQDTQSRLRYREEENALLKTDLEATRRTLREKSELASATQQRLEEMGSLNRLLQSSSARPPAVDGSASQHVSLHQHRQDPRITHYLMSVGHLEPAYLPAEREGDVGSQQETERTRRQLFDTTLSQCESVWSDCSVKSGSTFDTRDEAAFRDGLAALDASIASLQETIQLDLRR